MTQRDDILNDDDLNDIFADARASALTPSAAFMAQILEDAHGQQEAQGAGVPNWASSTPPVRQPLGQRILDFLGGWGGATGLATATVTGLVIGLGTPETVTTIASGTWAVESTTETADAESYAIDDLMPSFYDLALEG